MIVTTLYATIPLPTGLKTNATLPWTQSLLVSASQSVSPVTVSAGTTQIIYYVPATTTTPDTPVPAATTTKVFTITPHPSVVVSALHLIRTWKGTVKEPAETISGVNYHYIGPGLYSTLIAEQRDQLAARCRDSETDDTTIRANQI